MLPVTICLPVLNDKALLENSLNNIHTRAAEVLILDFGSADHAPAPHAQVKTLSLTWQAHWGQVKHFARTHSSHPWILWLHPGETLTDENWLQLERQLANAMPGSCLEIRCQTSRDIRCEPRLFSRDHAEYEQDILFPLFRNHMQAEMTPTSIVLEAHAESWSRQTLETESLLTACITQNLQTSQALFLSGLKAFERQDDSKAAALFRQLLTQPAQENDYTQSAAHLFALKLMWEKQDYQAAFEELERFRHAHTLLEKHPALWVMRGVMARHVQEKDLARECFHQALSQSQHEHFYNYNPFVLLPDVTWKPWLGLGDLYIENQLYNQAFHAYLNAQKHKQDLPGLNARLLRTAFLTEEYATVETLLSHAPQTVNLSETVHQALQSICSLHLHQHANPALSREQAEALLTQMKTYSDSAPDPFVMSLSLEYALQLLRQGDFESARPLLKYMSLKLPGQAMLWHNLAYSYFSDRDYVAAEQYYRQALQVDPNFSDSRMDLGKVLVMQGKLDAACEEFEHILQIHPHHLQARKALAQIRGELQPVVTPLATRTLDAVSTPFIFLFPLAPTWENGIDIALKAYYEEFVASDNVLLVIPATPNEHTLLEKAEAWANQKYTPDLLPPVLQIHEALPLLPEQTCLLLPFRVPPAKAVLEKLQQAPVLGLYPGSQHQTLPTGYLPSHCHADSSPSTQTQQARLWWEIELQVLKNQMRLGLENTDAEPEISPTEWTTHTLLALESPQVAQTQYISTPESIPEQRISVCMIVKDEAYFIRSCLESFIQDVDEVIVVDTGSRDQTLEIVRSFPKTQIFEYPWHDDFASARNHALEKASCPWILVLDADEYLPDGFIKSVKTYLNHHNPRTDAYVFSVVALDEDGLEKKEDTLPVPRLFANHPTYRFQGRIHELLTRQDQERMRYIHLQGLPIYHRGYQKQIRAERQKLQRDTGLMLQMIQENPKCPETERMYLILGNMAEQADQSKEALHYYQQGKANVSPESPLQEALQKSIWRVELKRGNPDSLLENLNPSQCEDPEALLLWAEAAHQKDMNTACIQACERALHFWERDCLKPDLFGKRPTRENLLWHLVQANTATAQYTQALYFCERLLKENSENPDYWLSYRQLKRQSQSHSG